MEIESNLKGSTKQNCVKCSVCNRSECFYFETDGKLIKLTTVCLKFSKYFQNPVFCNCLKFMIHQACPTLVHFNLIFLFFAALTGMSQFPSSCLVIFYCIDNRIATPPQISSNLLKSLQI